jgi:hypothetical protein
LTIAEGNTTMSSTTTSSTSSTVLRRRAAQLHTACARRGLRLRDGAAEQFLTDRIRAVATLMRISEGEAMRRYLTDDGITRLVDVFADGAARLQSTIDTASPLLLPTPDAVMVVAALGQVACWAAANTARDPWHATAIAETAGTMVTQWAIAISHAHGQDATVIVAANTAVRTRNLLATMADKLATGTWNTPPGPDNANQHDANLRLRDAIIRDLALLT